MEIVVRKTEERDWRDLKHIRLESLKDAPTAFNTSFDEASKVSDLEWRDRAKNLMPLSYFMAYIQSNPIGIVGSVVHNGEYHLISMWVKPSYRRKGVAEHLIDTIFAHAQEEGFAAVALTVSVDNKAASTLYQKKGFVFVDHYKQLESHPEIDVQKMRAKLGQSV